MPDASGRFRGISLTGRAAWPPPKKIAGGYVPAESAGPTRAEDLYVQELAAKEHWTCNEYPRIK